MRKSLGFLIALWGISLFFQESMSAFDSAFSESMKAAEAAAIAAQQSWEE